MENRPSCVDRRLSIHLIPIQFNLMTEVGCAVERQNVILIHLYIVELSEQAYSYYYMLDSFWNMGKV